MMVSHGTGVQADISRSRLPADAYPALFAYSLNRKLRYLYDGNYFRYRQASGGEFDYPDNTPNLNEDVYVVKIYDQKSNYNIPTQDIEQADTNLQPKLEYTDNPAGEKEYKAVFNQKEYFDIPNLVSHVGQYFTITAIGDGTDIPRPLIGIWGANDIVTFEPSDLTTRFCFNSNMGTISQQDGRAVQCFSGYEWTQNYTNVMSVRTSSENAFRTRPSIIPGFTQMSIGRQGLRYYEGTFSEAVMHLEQLTKVGSDQLFTTTRTQYGY